MKLFSLTLKKKKDWYNYHSETENVSETKFQSNLEVAGEINEQVQPIS